MKKANSDSFNIDDELNRSNKSSPKTMSGKNDLIQYDEDDDASSEDSAGSVSDAESNEDLDVNIDNTEVSLGAFISKTDKKIPRPQ